MVSHKVHSVLKWTLVVFLSKVSSVNFNTRIDATPNSLFSTPLAFSACKLCKEEKKSMYKMYHIHLFKNNQRVLSFV